MAKPKKATAKASPRRRKTPAKSPAQPDTVPQAHGGALRVGNPGNKGGTGRPPDAWKEACRNALSRADFLTIAERVLKDPKHPAWLGAAKFLAEHGHGKPAQPVDVGGSVTLLFDA